MADLKVFRLTAIGPSGGIYSTVDTESVRFMDGLRQVVMSGQNLSPRIVGVTVTEPTLEWTEKRVAYGTYATVTALGMHFRAFSDTGGGDGSGNISIIQNAFVVPQTVRCSKGGAAETTLRALFKGAATTGTTSTDPTTASEVMTLGATTFNGSALDGIESQEVDFGLDIWTDAGQSGSQYPTNLVILGNRPVATIVTTDLNIVKTYVAGGTITSSSVVKFDNQISTGGFGYTIPKAYVVGRVNGGSPATGTLTLTALYNGSDAVMTGAVYA